MLIADAQRDVRSTFLGGSVGQLVSAALWAVSAALATWGRPRQAIIVLVVGGFFIFPATQLGLRLLGGSGRLAPSNPFGQLGMQVAFTLPLSLPLVGAAALYRMEWFYPAFMIVLGAHYLPFVFLYGMPMFYALAAVLVASGFAFGRFSPGPWHVGAWVTAVTLLVFGVVGRVLVNREGILPRRGAFPDASVKARARSGWYSCRRASPR